VCDNPRVPRSLARAKWSGSPVTSDGAVELKRLQALQDVGVALGSALDLDEILDLVATRAQEVIDVERVVFFLWDMEKQTLRLRSRPADTVDGSAACTIALGQGFAGWVVQHGVALRVQDASADRRHIAAHDHAVGIRTRNTLCVPMKNHLGRVMGVMQAINKRPGGWTHEDETLMTALASQAALSVENSRLFYSLVKKNMELLQVQEQLDHRARELNFLFELAQISVHAREFEDLIDGILVHAIQVMDVAAASLLINTTTLSDTAELWFRSAEQTTDSRTRRILVRPGEGICGWVAEHGEPQIVDDFAAHPGYSPGLLSRLEFEPHNGVFVPLRWEQDGTTGAFELLDKHGGRSRFHEDDRKIATVIGGHIVTAVNLIRARQQRERQERLTTLGTLLSGVLHDLKTPLTVISGYTQQMVDEGDAAVRDLYGQKIRKQVEQINSMTKETLAFARGDRTVLIRKVYLNEFFQDLQEQIDRDIQDHRIEFRLDIQDRTTAYFDEHKIQRLLHNLIRNARQAITRSLERSEHADSDTKRITLRAYRNAPSSTLHLEVHDNGPGISDSVRNRLFETFATWGKQGGTGLGLAIVQKIVDEHHGQIRVASEPGNTTFHIELPQPATQP
jgi:signal transduction histidine kinase/putative methionine-R-sulfoxide reductase with GAF domain/uncharacterized protein YihD (DUF1040 family)